MQEKAMLKGKRKIRQEKMRAKFRSAFTGKVEVISMNEQDNTYDFKNPQSSFIFSPRISTGETQQITPFELQNSYYEDLTKGNFEISEKARET